jgi:murein DD-endopeptidase MepM/ murein hydrolase activator NlpD
MPTKCRQSAIAFKRGFSMALPRKAVALQLAVTMLVGACGAEAPTSTSVEDPGLAAIPVADGVDFPFGSGDCAARPLSEYSVSWDFADPSYGTAIVHTGEDWNRVGVGDADFGDSVCAIASGAVVEARSFARPGNTWGRVILIKHHLPDGVARWSQYAHLGSIQVSVGMTVSRGQVIGTIGRQFEDGPACVAGENCAHLHFEIRSSLLAADHTVGVGSEDAATAQYLDPTDEGRDLRIERGFVESFRFFAPSLASLCTIATDGSQLDCGPGTQGPGYLALVRGTFPQHFGPATFPMCGTAGTYGASGFAATNVAEFFAINGTAGCDVHPSNFWIAFLSVVSGPYNSDHVVGYVQLRRVAPGLWTAATAP